MGKKGGSVAGHGFSVAASPFNRVKLELGIILLVAPLVWLLVGRLLSAPEAQLMVLALYGIAGAGWLIMRTRQVIDSQPRRSDGAQQE